MSSSRKFRSNTIPRSANAGVKLSGGQRQRIAIARVILKDAPVLILDEATSSLDSITEKTIQDSLNEVMKGKTVIVVAHRLSTIAHLDRILVFHEGRIIEDGRPAELVARRGAYYRLWSRQADGFLGEGSTPKTGEASSELESAASAGAGRRRIARHRGWRRLSGPAGCPARQNMTLPIALP